MSASSCGLGLTERTTAEALGPGEFCVKFDSCCELRFVIKSVGLFGHHQLSTCCLTDY